MALKDLLYVPFHRAYTSKDILHWFEYLTAAIPCDVRIPRYDPICGVLQGKDVTLEFMCCSPAGGPVTGFAFRSTNGTHKRYRKAETALLRRIHHATKRYDAQYFKHNGK